MPNSAIKSFAERSKKSEEEVEKIWDDVAKAAKSKFDDEDDDYWAYVNKTVQFKLGLAHKKTKFKEFSKKKDTK